MPSISDAQVNIIDDNSTALLQAVNTLEDSPEKQQFASLIVEIQQIASSLKGEGAGDTGAPAGNSSQSISASLAGGAAMTMEMCMASGKSQQECQLMMQQQNMMGQNPMMGGSEVYTLLADSIGQVLDTLESKLGGAEGQPEIWNNLASTENYLRALGGADYPWDQCISEQSAKYGMESAKNICGAIKRDNS